MHQPARFAPAVIVTEEGHLRRKGAGIVVGHDILTVLVVFLLGLAVGTLYLVDEEIVVQLPDVRAVVIGHHSEARIVIEDVIVPDKCGLANRLYNASLPSFAIHHQPLPSATGVGVAGDERQQVTPRLDLDSVHLMGLDDLNVNHGIGECFP